MSQSRKLLDEIVDENKGSQMVCVCVCFMTDFAILGEQENKIVEICAILCRFFASPC